MSEAKFTKGPWGRHCPNIETTHICTADKDGNPNGIVATLNRVAWCNDGEHQANARLIASAPELLEALEQAAKQFDYTVSAMAQGHTVSVSSLQNCAAQARLAIAKAKGQS